MGDLEFRPLTLGPDALAFLDAVQGAAADVASAFRLPADLVRGEPVGPSPWWEAVREGATVDALTAALCTAWRPRWPCGGTSRTTPVSRKFFPPRHGHI